VVFLEDIVKPNMAEFDADYASLRLAFNAVAAVDALAAHLFWWCKVNVPANVAAIKDDDEFRRALAKKHPDYALLHDIAKANKHVQLVRGSPEITSASKVEAKPLGFGEGGYGEGGYGGPPQVIITTDAGDKRIVGALRRCPSRNRNKVVGLYLSRPLA
jgi:hypothetical protein